jgi:S-adenosylmethionine hydrolase
MLRPIITLLTDFGVADYYVGAMKGVMLGICPEAQLVDITHEIAPFQIGHGASVLEQAWKCFPAGTVHVAVVDPGVGSERRPIVAEAGGHLFVAPDNGLLTRVFRAVENPVVREISAKQFFREPVSRTFHGRDIFAPVAAHLAAGVSADKMGRETKSFSVLATPEASQVSEDTWQAEVLWADRFGNVVTNLRADAFSSVRLRHFEMRAGEATVSRYAEYYSAMDEGIPYLVAGSAGYLEIALNQRDTARDLGISAGDKLTLHLRPVD